MKLPLFSVLFAFALLLAAAGAAASCPYNTTKLSDVHDVSLSAVPGASTLIGNNKVAHLAVDNTSYYYEIKGGMINAIGATNSTDLEVATDSCTVSRILSGENPLKEYNAGTIRISATSFGLSVKLWFAKIGATIYGWFS